MKKQFLLILLITAVSFNCLGQQINYIVKTAPTSYIEYFDTASIKKNQKLIHLKHSSSKIERPEDLEILKNEVIYSIQLIYTEPDRTLFDQEKLNAKRLTHLKKIAPELIENNLIAWEFIEQKRTEKYDDEKLFHGYLITLRPKLEGKDGVSEFEILKKLINEKKSLCDGYSYSEELSISYGKGENFSNKIKHAPTQEPEFPGGRTKFFNYLKDNIQYTQTMFKDNVSGEFVIKFHIDEQGNISKISSEEDLTKECRIMVKNTLKNSPKWLPGVQWVPGVHPPKKILIGGVFNLSFFFSLEQQTIYIKYLYHQGPYREPTANEMLDDYLLPKHVLCDSSVFNTFERNKHWKKISVVADLTCSMYPYTNQLIMWFRLSNYNNIGYLTFFNDGDGIPNDKKKIGEVGGIYQSKASSYEDVLSLAEKTMTCCSGDIIENNIESIIAAIEKFPEAEEIVMIADNYATPRDLKLLKKIKRPIRIILCGVKYGINVEYLNLAKKNGGSIHTMEHDITELIQMKEGGELEFNGKKYKIVNGKFEQIYDR